jgi:RNA polymerase sigma-70 factor (ECF subfamily)
MSTSEKSEGLTRLLRRVAEGDDAALGQLYPIVYDDLRELADRQLRRERADHTLQPTALVHEAFLKLSAAAPEVVDRAHFAAIAARVMRQVLVDHARRRGADKRGGGWIRTTLGEGRAAVGLDPDELLALDRALDTLDERQRQVVEYRFFGGLEEREIASLLGVTERTVRRDWVKARAWLYASIYGRDESSGDEGP